MTDNSKSNTSKYLKAGKMNTTNLQSISNSNIFNTHEINFKNKFDSNNQGFYNQINGIKNQNVKYIIHKKNEKFSLFPFKIIKCDSNIKRDSNEFQNESGLNKKSTDLIKEKNLSDLHIVDKKKINSNSSNISKIREDKKINFPLVDSQIIQDLKDNNSEDSIEFDKDSKFKIVQKNRERLFETLILDELHRLTHPDGTSTSYVLVEDGKTHKRMILQVPTHRVEEKLEAALLDESDHDYVEGQAAGGWAGRADVGAEIDKRSLDYVLRSGLAGGLAGCTAKTIIAPLDRVKILFQTSNPQFKKYSGSTTGLIKAIKSIYNTSGIWGLFQGHSVTLARVFPYAAVKFVAYEQIRAILIPRPEYETNIRRLMAGSLSGITSVFLTYPLELLRVRMAVSNTISPSTSAFKQPNSHNIGHSASNTRPSVVHMARQIFNENPLPQLKHINSQDSNYLQYNFYRLLGVRNFFRGFTPTILGMIPYAGVSFWTHDTIHDFLRGPKLAPYTVLPETQVTRFQRNKKIISNDSRLNNKTNIVNNSSTDYKDNQNNNKNGKYNTHDGRPPLKVWAQLFAGGIAGMTAQTASYPLEVIRRRMQVLGSATKNPGILEIGKTIIRADGPRGLFVGLSIGYIKVVPMVACSFFVYERLKYSLGI